MGWHRMGAVAVLCERCATRGRSQCGSSKGFVSTGCWCNLHGACDTASSEATPMTTGPTGGRVQSQKAAGLEWLLGTGALAPACSVDGIWEETKKRRVAVPGRSNQAECNQRTCSGPASKGANTGSRTREWRSCTDGRRWKGRESRAEALKERQQEGQEEEEAGAGGAEKPARGRRQEPARGGGARALLAVVGRRRLFAGPACRASEPQASTRSDVGCETPIRA